MKLGFCKKIIAVILVVAIALGTSGCFLRSDAERFDAYVQDVFRQMLEGETLTLHYFLTDPQKYGISTETVRLGTVLPNASLGQLGITIADSVELEIQKMEFLFHYEKLTASQQVVYDQLRWYLEVSKLYDGFDYYSEYCLGSGSVVTNLPLMMAEFQFRTQQDIDTYLKLLKSYDSYFSEIIQYEQEKSRLGLFMSDYSLDNFQENCQRFLYSGKENVLLISFEDRIAAFDGLNADAAQEYISQNKIIVETVVMPAYEKLSNALEQLRGTGENEGGVCNFEKGKEYYEFLAAGTVGSDMTVMEMYTALTAAMSEIQTEFIALLTENPALEQEILNFAFAETDPYAVLDYLKEQTKKDYPEIPEVTYTVKSISKYLNNTNVVAFYILSPIDAMETQTIYMNDTRNFAGADVFTTLAHEGYPGHMYQTIYFSNTNPNPASYLFRTTGYQEGWATYVENESYRYSGIQDKNVIRALQLDSAYNLLFNAYLDIAINYQGMEFDEFYALLQSLAVEEETARMAYQAFVEDPGVYLPYAIGFLKFKELREKAEETLGNDFVLKEFHETVLELGAVPFTMLDDHVNAWLEEKTLAPAA